MEQKEEVRYKGNIGKVKAYQELNKEISNDRGLRNMQPTPEPKDFEEIEY